jgi:hypothetical protein
LRSQIYRVLAGRGAEDSDQNRRQGGVKLLYLKLLIIPISVGIQPAQTYKWTVGVTVSGICPSDIILHRSSLIAMADTLQKKRAHASITRVSTLSYRDTCGRIRYRTNDMCRTHVPPSQLSRYLLVADIMQGKVGRDYQGLDSATFLPNWIKPKFIVEWYRLWGFLHLLFTWTINITSILYLLISFPSPRARQRLRSSCSVDDVKTHSEIVKWTDWECGPEKEYKAGQAKAQWLVKITSNAI